MIFRLIATVKVLLGVAAILLTGNVLAAPANDSFAERIQLSGTNVNFTVTLAGAEASSGGYGEVWWEWEAKMTWGDTFNLDKWLEDYSLDQLWAMNIMGGRP